MARGGRREGAGRKPLGVEMVRLGPRLEAGLLARVDRARKKIEAPKGITRAEFFRRGLAELIRELEAEPGRAFIPPVVEGAKKAFPLELPVELAAQAEALVAAGRASMIDLLRGAGALLAEKVGVP
jgi:hypothetical protein